MADEAFEVFLNVGGFGPPIPGKSVPQAAFEKYAGVLPAALLRIWAEFGWAGFGDGRFWLTDPDEWSIAFEEWFGGVDLPLQDRFHVIARDAFGNFDCWGERTGPSLNVGVVDGELFVGDDSTRVQARGADWSLNMWLLGHSPDRIDVYRNDETPVFADARRVLGQLTYDEVYGFFPPVALSGGPENSDIHKVGAIVQLSILSQLAPNPLTVHTFGPITITQPPPPATGPGHGGSES
ncbi:MAG: GAD-like domain-containing protein [Geodermatophilaceae bacterium]